MAPAGRRPGRGGPSPSASLFCWWAGRRSGFGDADPEQPLDPTIPQPATGAELERVPWDSVIWPYGTTVVADGNTYAVRLADGRTYRIGKFVTGGAGVFPMSGGTPSYGLPRACTSGHGVLLFRPETD